MPDADPTAEAGGPYEKWLDHERLEAVANQKFDRAVAFREARDRYRSDAHALSAENARMREDHVNALLLVKRWRELAAAIKESNQTVHWIDIERCADQLGAALRAAEQGEGQR